MRLSINEAGTKKQKLGQGANIAAQTYKRTIRCCTPRCLSSSTACFPKSAGLPLFASPLCGLPIARVCRTLSTRAPNQCPPLPNLVALLGAARCQIFVARSGDHLSMAEGLALMTLRLMQAYRLAHCYGRHSRTLSDTADGMRWAPDRS